MHQVFSFCHGEEDYLHVLKNKHGLALPRACAIELDNTPIKTQGLENLDLLQSPTVIRYAKQSVAVGNQAQTLGVKVVCRGYTALQGIEENSKSPDTLCTCRKELT